MLPTQFIYTCHIILQPLTSLEDYSDLGHPSLHIYMQAQHHLSGLLIGSCMNPLQAELHVFSKADRIEVDVTYTQPHEYLSVQHYHAQLHDSSI